MTLPDRLIRPPTRSELVRAAVRHRSAGLPAWVVVTQLFIGLGWLRAATEKIIDPSWWNGDGLARFLGDHDGAALGWYQPFLDLVVARNVVPIAVVVIVAQLFAGTSLVSGRAQAAGLTVGMFLNLNFLAAGAVNPSAFYLLSQGGLALWLAERARRRCTLLILNASSLVATVLVVASVPFITTLDPAQVIEDPALMLSTGGTLTVVACHVAHRNLTGGSGLAWLTTSRAGTRTSFDREPETHASTAQR